MLTTGLETMKAIVQDEYGDAQEVLAFEETDRPELGADEVLVRVHAAGVDRGTWHLVAGLPHLIRFMGYGIRNPKTRVAGRALAGTVEAVGAKVTGFAVGDDVFGTANGSFAEYASAPAKTLALKPANLSFEQSAAVPISAHTALQAVRRATVGAGDKVLIIGASGGVGTFAVQIAKAFGADVTGVCSTAKVEIVRALGADHVIDYQRENFADRENVYDVILDIGGSSRLARLRRPLKRDGRLVIVGGETDGKWLGGFDRSLRAPLVSLFVGQKLTMLASTESSEDLTVLRELIESGTVTPEIDRTFPLSDAAAAVQYLHEGRARGKVVITV